MTNHGEIENLTFVRQYQVMHERGVETVCIYRALSGHRVTLPRDAFASLDNPPKNISIQIRVED